MNNKKNKRNYSLELNGIQINSLNPSALVAKLRYLLNTQNLSCQIITFNTDFLRLTYLDEQFKSICINSQMVVPDGVGITILIKLKYGLWLGRITGTTLFEAYLDLANAQGLKVALVGSSVNTHEKLNELINRKWPNAKIKSLSPKMNFEKSQHENEGVVNEIRRFKPTIMMVALGCPRQEKWIYANKDIIGAKINMGVGGVFDFVSGQKPRAPEWIQKIGLEWIWRLMHEPKRLSKRYLLHDLPFFLKTMLKVLLRLDA